MRFPHHAAKTGQRLSYTQLLHMRRLLLIFSTSFILYSCDPGRNALTGKVDAYVPVYNSLSDVQKISVVAQQPTLLAGKIYAYKNYIFQNDLNTGIHIIDNSDPQNPKKIAFIKIPMTSEIAVKGNYLYANNYVDLVVFNITNAANPQFVKRVPGVFSATSQKFPTASNGYFQCPDVSKGIVIRWELQNIDIPNCRR